MAEKKKIGPNGENRWNNDLGDTKYIMNYYLTKKSDPRYYEINYEDFIYARDKYGKVPMIIYYFYDEKQNCTDMLVDLRKVYEQIPEFDSYYDYDEFLSHVVDLNNDYHLGNFSGRVMRKGMLDEEAESTSMLLIKMREYPHNEEGNKLAHFADVLADLIQNLNDLADKDYDKRTLKSILKDIEHINVNGLFYFVLGLIAAGLLLLIIGLVKQVTWVWIVGIIVAVIGSGWFGMAMLGQTLEKNEYRSEDYKETKCGIPDYSRFDR